MITLLDDELYVDSLWESFSSSASRLQRLGADPAAVRARRGRRGRRMTLSCTRERGATPSRHTADIAAATRFCLTTAGAHFRCPSDPGSGAPTRVGAGGGRRPRFASATATEGRAAELTPM